MPAAALPRDENLRLQELNLYNILDTLPEKEYDNITEMLSIICDCPIALVSIVDKDRQWFKSRVGLEAEETHRDLAFCAHAILDQDNTFIVEDAAEDPRFKENGLVTGAPHIRFYAGQPLTTSSGVSLGTLCAIDRKPRTLADSQAKALKLLASHVVSLLELRRKQAEQEKLIDRLTDANLNLDKFAHTAAHDLQAPLRNARHFSSLVKSCYSEEIGEAGGRFIDNIDTSLESMQNLIEELLNFAKIDNFSNDNVTSIQAESVLNSAKLILALQIDSVGAHITNDPLPEILVNEVKFSCLLQNLIGNAMKYQPTGQAPCIHIGIKETQKEWIFSISDNGIGIKPRFLQRIFEPFKRLHAKSEYEGTGLGLALCQNIVKCMGGRIWVESEGENSGSTFYFTVPKAL
ncbi:MAG: sensor histidine kinase [Alphaproteobacteria bacterium]